MKMNVLVALLLLLVTENFGASINKNLTDTEIDNTTDINTAQNVTSDKIENKDNGKENPTISNDSKNKSVNNSTEDMAVLRTPAAATNTNNFTSEAETNATIDGSDAKKADLRDKSIGTDVATENSTMNYTKTNDTGIDFKKEIFDATKKPVHVTEDNQNNITLPTNSTRTGIEPIMETKKENSKENPKNNLTTTISDNSTNKATIEVSASTAKTEPLDKNILDDTKNQSSTVSPPKENNSSENEKQSLSIKATKLSAEEKQNVTASRNKSKAKSTPKPLKKASMLKTEEDIEVDPKDTEVEEVSKTLPMVRLQEPLKPDYDLTNPYPRPYMPTSYPYTNPVQIQHGYKVINKIPQYVIHQPQIEVQHKQVYKRPDYVVHSQKIPEEQIAALLQHLSQPRQLVRVPTPGVII